MAKLSCSYFLIFMFVFSVVLVAEGEDDENCIVFMDPKNPCNIVDCRQNCYEGYNGVGKCVKDVKAGGDTCLCTYNWNC
ncbi:hypothetical protein F2Q69_00028130 [Brassica cretica]|uniref:Defensin-like protein n=1 Tax=Brassica cretica TaxID=69181 RepID=A0A8S9RSV2_BRACR|nr:hypothetical protein F2Q69_00028130 [Brassica cretica]